MSERTFITPEAFSGSDAERINLALAAAAGTGRRVVIPPRALVSPDDRNVWLLDSAILVPGDTTLELHNCHLKLSDRCRDNFLRSANCGLGIEQIEPLSNIHIYGTGSVLLEGADRPRATGDAGKTLGSHTYGSDAGVEGESQRGDWRNIGLLFAYVEHFSIRNLMMKDSHCWGVSLERCAHGAVSDLRFASTGSKVIDGSAQTILNQDGLDLRLGCHDIIIENITGYSGDDLIALTAIPGLEQTPGSTCSTMVSASVGRGDSDAIRNVIIRNVVGYCAGGHHIVRFLNTPGARMHDLMLDGLIDTSGSGTRCRAAVKIGDHHYGGGFAPLGETSRITVSNVTSRAEHTIMIGGSLCDSIISNIIRYDVSGEAVTMVAGPEHVKDVVFANIHVSAPEVG